MNPMKDFFDLERKRVFTPGPFFTQRVLARLGLPRVQESGTWEVISISSRLVLGLALILILCFVAVHVIIPQIPQRGMIEAYLDSDQNPAESFLYSEADPSGQEFLEVLIALEEQQ